MPGAASRDRPKESREGRGWAPGQGMVRDAVRSEPVSSLISLFNREFTGKMQFSGHIQASRWLANPQISAIPEPSSLRTEQGILAKLTGKQIVRISELP